MDTSINFAPDSTARTHQPALRGLVAMEALKLRKRLMTRIVFGFVTIGMAGFMSLAYLWVRLASYPSAAEREVDLDALMLPAVFTDVNAIIGGLGGILIAMLAASMVGSEFGWGTVRVLVGSGVTRTRLLAAKVVALFETIVLFVVAGLLTGVTMSLAFALIGGHGVSLDWVSGDTLSDILMIVVRQSFMLMIPAIVAFTVAVVARSLAAGIAVGIGLQIIDQILSSLLGSIGGFAGRLQDLLLTTNLSAIDQYNTVGTPQIDTTLPDVWQAVGLLTLYSAVMLSVAFAAFGRRDIASGS